MDLLKELEKERKERQAPDAAGDIKAPKDGGTTSKVDDGNKTSSILARRKVNNYMDIRDFLRKVDSIQNKEQMKEDVKRIHVKEASQVMLYGDTPKT